MVVFTTVLDVFKRIKNLKEKIIYTTIGKRIMLFKKSHIEFAIDCLAARGDFEGADSRGILP